MTTQEAEAIYKAQQTPAGKMAQYRLEQFAEKLRSAGVKGASAGTLRPLINARTNEIHSYYTEK